MALSRFRTFAAALMLTLATACGGSDSNGNGPGNPNADVPSSINTDDVVAVTDLLVKAESAVGAYSVGEAARYLAAAQKESSQHVAHLKAVLDRIEGAVAKGNPDKSGKTKSGEEYALWTLERDGFTSTLFVVRTGPDRVRYLVTGKKGDVSKPLLTGVFIKKGKRAGGGRVHVNLTNVYEITGAGTHTGAMHVMFANHKSGVVARRVIYRGIRPVGDMAAPPLGYGADYLHKKGEGGRFRTLLLGDVIDELEGREAIGMRVRWKNGEGGRADLVIANAREKTRLHASECWDAGGLRTAFKDEIMGNESVDPDVDDPSAPAKCGGFMPDMPPDAQANDDAQDIDEEVAQALAETGADAISEADASLDLSPEG